MIHSSNSRKKIHVLTSNGDAENDFIHDARSDFWQSVETVGSQHVELVKQANPLLRLDKLLYTFLEKVFRTSRLPVLQRAKKKIAFSMFLGPNFSTLLRYRLLGYEVVFYMMDAWPSYHPRIENAFRLLNVRTAFFSSRQVCEKFSALFPQLSIHWIPEAIRFEKYYSNTIRDIDVLSFGRKWEQHHKLIVDSLSADGVTYWYEKVKGQLILPNRTVFLDAISRAKITLCVPSSITHPERSEGIETLTWRYLQCMAARSLLLGKAPKELVDLFGYNPIVEIDLEDPVGQIRSVLKNYAAYGSLIERNYRETANHSWKARWENIDRILNDDS